MNKPKSVDEYYKEAPQSKKIEFKPFSQRLLEQKIAECERLQKQLDIAVNTLKCYANPDNWDYNRFTNFFATWKLASDNLEKIKELDNV